MMENTKFEEKVDTDDRENGEDERLKNADVEETRQRSENRLYETPHALELVKGAQRSQNTRCAKGFQTVLVAPRYKACQTDADDEEVDPIPPIS